MCQKNSEKNLYFFLSKENIKKNDSSCAILNEREKKMMCFRDYCGLNQLLWLIWIWFCLTLANDNFLFKNKNCAGHINNFHVTFRLLSMTNMAIGIQFFILNINFNIIYVPLLRDFFVVPCTWNHCRIVWLRAE